MEKISRGPGRSISLEENDRFRSEADSQVPLRDLHGLMLEGRFWMGFLLSKMSVGADFCVLFCFFFSDSLNVVHPIFGAFFWRSTCEKMAKTQRMVFENVCWQHVMMVQDLVQVLTTA